jgi:hypothetical protein
MNIRKMTLPALCGCIALLIAIQCTNPGSGTETGNPTITAMLYNPGGSPAASAKVCFYRHHDDPRNNHAVDSTYTDNNGNYSKDLDTGTYNILASLGANATFQDSIIVTEGDTTRPPPDTLKSLGSISGRIELQGTDDPRTVFILFMGSNTFTRPTDLVGNFSAVNMAKGKYAVSLLTTLDDYSVMDTSFVITAGLDSVIPQPIVMRYTGIPVPKGLRIEYDTMMQIVTLFWNTPTTGRTVQSYTVYRKRNDSATFVNIKAGVTDTAYSDSTGVQDQTYEYRVAVVDTQNTTGVMSTGYSILITGIFQLSNKLFNSSIIDPRGIVVDSNAIISFVNFNASHIVKMDTNGVILNTVNLRDNMNNLILGLRVLTIDENGNYYATSDNGVFWLDSTGTFLAKFDSVDYGYGIALSDSFAFVVYSHAIRKFSRDGHFIDQWADDEFSPGYVRSPGGIALSNDSLIVFDGLNAKIQIYSTSGQFLGEWVTFISPGGPFIIDKQGYIIISQGAKIQVFTKDGNFLARYYTGVVNEFPQGIALDKANNLYLTLNNQNTGQYSVAIFKSLLAYW